MMFSHYIRSLLDQSKTMSLLIRLSIPDRSNTFLVKIENLSGMCFGSSQFGSGIMKTQPKFSEMTQISVGIIRVI